jgi:hypothetical protein
LQLLIPLSSEFAIVFYDEAAYEFGTRASNVVRIASRRHIRSINSFQWANAGENLYFSPATYFSELHADAAEFVAIRESEHVELSARSMQIDSNRKGILLSVQTKPSSRQLHMPLFRRRIVAPPLGDVAHLPLRNPEWAHHVRRLIEAVEADQITMEQFQKATQRIPVERRKQR